jgi:hypothetical protein
MQGLQPDRERSLSGTAEAVPFHEPDTAQAVLFHEPDTAQAVLYPKRTARSAFFFLVDHGAHFGTEFFLHVLHNRMLHGS